MEYWAKPIGAKSNLASRSTCQCRRSPLPNSPAAMSVHRHCSGPLLSMRVCVMRPVSHGGQPCMRMVRQLWRNGSSSPAACCVFACASAGAPIAASARQRLRPPYASMRLEGRRAISTIKQRFTVSAAARTEPLGVGMGAGDGATTGDGTAAADIPAIVDDGNQQPLEEADGGRAPSGSGAAANVSVITATALKTVPQPAVVQAGDVVRAGDVVQAGAAEGSSLIRQLRRRDRGESRGGGRLLGGGGSQPQRGQPPLHQPQPVITVVTRPLPRVLILHTGGG